ncbi:MAG: hypothetical protein IKB34_09205, partial [Clostridia bacterium]|nr:hypothetical protein [Clostridia bacterium]
DGKCFTADHGDGVTMSVIGSREPNVIVAQKQPIFIGWRKRGGANSEDFEHHHAPCLSFEAVGTEKRFATVLYPSNNGEVAIKDVVISDDPTDTWVKLVLTDGETVTVDERDYPAYSDSEEKLV